MSQERKVAITGKSGFVGGEIIRGMTVSDSSDYCVIPLGRGDLDITCPRDILDFLVRVQPYAFVNFAAYTDVNAAERDRVRAYSSNVIVPWHEGRTTKASQREDGKAIHLISIGSDFEYPGSKDAPGPYAENFVTEESHKKHLGWYAQTKLDGRRMLEDMNHPNWSHVVIGYPFGVVSEEGGFEEKDLISKYVKLIKRGLPLFTDQNITPTFIPDLTRALGVIINKGVTGRLHVASGPVITPFEFGEMLTEAAGLSEIYHPKEGSLRDYMSKEGVAPRPQFGGLSTRVTEEKLEMNFTPVAEALRELAPDIRKEFFKS